MRKVFEIGGVVAAAILVAFGIAAIVMGVNGRTTVRDSLKLEQIVGSPDMTPADHGPQLRQYLRWHRAPAHSRATCGSTRSRRPGD